MSALDEAERRLFQLWRPPPRLTLSQWADQYFYLSAESAAEPGRWKTLPYQRGIMDAITDPETERVSVMKSARVGFTKMLNATIGHYVHYDPCPIMVVQPTIEDAEGYSKEEIAPMIRDVPVLAELFPEAKAKDGENTILHKIFRGGSLSMVGANSPRGFRRVSRKVVLFDEIDGYPPSAGAEGDQLKLAERRTEYYWDRKLIYGSTPTIAGRSRIETLFLAGDQRRYYVPCPHCGYMDILVFRREFTLNGEPRGHFMHWPKDQPDKAHFVCRDCGSAIEHTQKRDMIENGEWRAHAPFNGHASFHIWAAYSYSPNASWGQIAKEFIEAAHHGPEQLKTFVNTVLGETWHDRGEAPEWERLYQRREAYQIGVAPAPVLFLTCGVDVQKDRLVWEVVGWGRGKRSWSIDAGVIPGDTSDTSPRGPWKDLDALLDRRFLHEGGTEMQIAMLAIDSGYNTQTVYGWARNYPMNRVAAIKGDDHASVLVGVPSAVDVTIGGRKLQKGYRVWPVSSKLGKTEFYGWLRLEPPTEENGGEEPPGFCHFPQYSEEYFRQITAEQLVPRKNKRGFIRHEWEVIPGRENHFLDCRIYARCAAAIVGLDRFQEADWRKLESAVGSPAKPPVPATDEDAESRDPPGAGGTSRGTWIPRQSGWLRRRR